MCRWSIRIVIISKNFEFFTQFAFCQFVNRWNEIFFSRRTVKISTNRSTDRSEDFNFRFTLNFHYHWLSPMDDRLDRCHQEFECSTFLNRNERKEIDQTTILLKISTALDEILYYFKPEETGIGFDRDKCWTRFGLLIVFGRIFDNKSVLAIWWKKKPL